MHLRPENGYLVMQLMILFSVLCVFLLIQRFCCATNVAVSLIVMMVIVCHQSPLVFSAFKRTCNIVSEILFRYFQCIELISAFVLSISEICVCATEYCQNEGDVLFLGACCCAGNYLTEIKEPWLLTICDGYLNHSFTCLQNRKFFSYSV